MPAFGANADTITFPGSNRGSYAFSTLANFQSGAYNNAGFTQTFGTFVISQTNPNLGVSVLCPALVATTLYASGGRRPTRLGGPFERPGADVEKAWQSAGLPPDEVGKRVLDAVAKAEFFIFTHEEPREWIEARHRRLMAGFDSIARYQAENRET